MDNVISFTISFRHLSTPFRHLFWDFDRISKFNMEKWWRNDDGFWGGRGICGGAIGLAYVYG